MLDEEWPSTIIFLDVDGVLNSQASRESMGNDLPSAKCLAHLAHLVNETDSALVLSSTWRFEADDVVVLEDALQQIGIGPIFGATPYWGAVDVASRGAEIQRWLQDSAPAVCSSIWICAQGLLQIALSSRRVSIVPYRTH